ncbi:unnamed protein product [Candida verbasci]|uniref:CCAAT-binding factor domain-containing protein n=1 Tax=Candida verbasci TaxID=1227364 RepID=A0A9W4XGK1_9ASCO|nr:unnamed protein product [Candida verbasci]
MTPKRKIGKSDIKSKRTKASEDDLLSVKELKKLSNEINEASKFNNFITLINQLSIVKSRLTSKEDHEIESTGRNLSVLIFKNFQTLFKNGLFKKNSSDSNDQALIKKWIFDKYLNFKKLTCQFLTDKLSFDSSLQLDLLDIYLNLIKLENNNDSQFPIQTYKQLIEALLTSKNGEILSNGITDNFIVIEFIEKFKPHYDLQFYFFQNIPEKPNKLQISNFLTIVRNELSLQDDLNNVVTFCKHLSPNIYKPQVFKSNFQKCITTILSNQLSTPQIKSVLSILHKRIIPYMSQPQQLMDFLTDCYNTNEEIIIPILALNSLWELMKNYNLEYQDFYTKLYSLITPNLLYTKYRSRFFRLCDLFLSSSHLSANLIASFIKRLSRISLISSGPGVVIIIPFIYNLLKRHPTCMIMIHNTNNSKDEFNNLEKDPLLTNAINSSLWELNSLTSHYHPNIATLCKIFGEPFRKPNYNLEDFLDWNYVTLLESENSRKFKEKATALEFEQFDSLLKTDESKESDNIFLENWKLV